MSSDYTPTRGRRSSRRGDQRSGRPNRGGSSRRQESTPSSYTKPKKKSFWQKIASFFGGSSSAPAAPARAQSAASEPAGDRGERKSRKPERPSGFRKPEIVEVTSARIYVGNLSFDATESDLSELFNGVGQVQNVEVVSNKYTQKSKGFAFVEMGSVDEAKRAVTELHDKEFLGRKLVVSGAKAAEEKRSSERSRQPERQPDQSEQSETSEQ